jgi:hypothetical protein
MSLNPKIQESPCQGALRLFRRGTVVCRFPACQGLINCRRKNRRCLLLCIGDVPWPHAILKQGSWCLSEAGFEVLEESFSVDEKRLFGGGYRAGLIHFTGGLYAIAMMLCLLLVLKPLNRRIRCEISVYKNI